jgi:hypothetical protein
MDTMHVVADTELNTFLRAFETRQEAVAYVERLLKTSGDGYAQNLAIGRQTDDGDFVDVTAGDDLLLLVRGGTPDRPLAGSGSGASGSSEGYVAMAAEVRGA